ncbi:MAG: hypothetical protein LBV27_04690 [Oscillospiraceae bacterium]|jgi:hypothetical protein|nr:hypothetical protein [Oscillospiraceae bacterium]
MKELLAIVICTTLILSLAACGKATSDGDTASNPESSTPESVSEAEGIPSASEAAEAERIEEEKAISEADAVRAELEQRLASEAEEIAREAMEQAAGGAILENAPQESSETQTQQSAQPNNNTAGNSWAGAYADFLKGQNFTFKEYLFYQDKQIFPLHNPNGGAMALMQVDFYQIPNFDYPVMVLTEFYPLASDPTALDTYQSEIAYIITDGSVVPAQAEDELIYGIFEESDMSYIKGEHLESFALTATSQTAVDTNLQMLYAWLDS